MEHYSKGKNVEYDEVLDPELARVLPVAPQDLTWIRIKPGSKVHNMIGPAGTGINGKGIIVISGFGPAVTKVVSCAEVVKRRYKVAHQITKLSSKIVEEHWEPTRDDLEPLKVTREIPNLQIVLSKEAFEGSHLQTKGSLESFLNISKSSGSAQSKHHRRPNSGKKSQNLSKSNSNGNNNSSESAAKELGLENHRKKRQKTNNRNGGGNKGGSTNERQGQNSGSPITNEKPQKNGGPPVNKAQKKDQISTVSTTNDGQQQQTGSLSNQTPQNNKSQKNRSRSNHGQPKTGSSGGDEGQRSTKDTPHKSPSQNMPVKET